MLSNANMGARGYDPYKDNNLTFSLDQLKRNLEEDSKLNNVPCTPTTLDITELSKPILSTTFNFAANQKYLTPEGTGVVLSSTIPVSISFAFDGALGKMMKLEDIKVKRIVLNGNGAITLLYKNKPKAQLENIVILPGGKVLVDDSKLVGSFEEIQNIELGLRDFFKALAALAIFKRTGVMPAVNPSIPRPSLTQSLVEVILEQEMRKAILDQIKNNNLILSNLLGDRITEDQKKNLDIMKIMDVKP